MKSEFVDTLIDSRKNDGSESGEEKYLTFSMGEEFFGINILDIIEIIGIQKITSISDVDESVKGVINLRGKIIPVIDLRIRFGLEKREYDERTTIIVVKIYEKEMGLIVDNVSEVIDLSENEIELHSKLYEDNSNQYIKGYGKIEKQVIIILDIFKMLADEDIVDN
jgi:purine-binding chemotaxis protein CheW